MTDTTGTEGSAAATCAVCAGIPPDLLVNTGRDETFPAEVQSLVPLELGQSTDLYRCPNCEALFEWEDLPQYYGSGNCDEERLTRLDPAQASTARELLDPEPGERDCEALCARALRTLSHSVVREILGHMAYNHPRAFAGFLAPLVARLAGDDDGSVRGIVMSYCGRRRDRLVELRRLLEAEGAAAGGSGEYLRTVCSERIEEADRRRGAGPGRT
jgi:hypothetical protein